MAEDLYGSKLYLFEPYLSECEATITSISTLPSDSKHGTHKLTLTRTIFHPQGGGQPTTTGKIVLVKDQIEHAFLVNFVQYNAVEHVVEHCGIFSENSEGLFVSGEVVRLSIDENTRKEHVKLHSSGHVIDAVVKRLGYDSKLKAGKGYHFPDGPYVEYTGELSEEELGSLSNLINNEIKVIIEENIPSSFQIVTKEEAGVLCGCDTSTYPDMVRVVEIAGHPCPCGGTHILNTVELGQLEVTKIKKKKKNVKISYEVK